VWNESESEGPLHRVDEVLQTLVPSPHSAPSELSQDIPFSSPPLPCLQPDPSFATLADIAGQFEAVAATYRVLSQQPELRRGGEFEKALEMVDSRLSNIEEKINKNQAGF
jgi:hypothetical protein